MRRRHAGDPFKVGHGLFLRCTINPHNFTSSGSGLRHIPGRRDKNSLLARRGEQRADIFFGNTNKAKELLGVARPRFFASPGEGVKGLNMARCYPLKGLLRRRFFKSGPEFRLAKQLGDPHVQNDAVSNPDLDGRAICTLKLWSISRSILRVDVGNLKVTKGEAFANLPWNSLRPRLARRAKEQHLVRFRAPSQNAFQGHENVIGRGQNDTLESLAIGKRVKLCGELSCLKDRRRPILGTQRKGLLRLDLASNGDPSSIITLPVGIRSCPALWATLGWLLAGTFAFGSNLAFAFALAFGGWSLGSGLHNSRSGSSPRAT